MVEYPSPRDLTECLAHVPRMFGSHKPNCAYKCVDPNSPPALPLYQAFLLHSDIMPSSRLTVLIFFSFCCSCHFSDIAQRPLCIIHHHAKIPLFLLRCFSRSWYLNHVSALSRFHLGHVTNGLISVRHLIAKFCTSAESFVTLHDTYNYRILNFSKSVFHHFPTKSENAVVAPLWERV